MELGFLGQQLWNGVMLGTIYAMVAVGFTLFFGVLDVIKFSHGDVLTLGVFAALATLGGLSALGVESTAVRLVAATLAGVGGMALLGAGIAKAFILPLREAPSFIVLLVTLMVGTVIREGIRLFYPGGSNPQSFPHLLPSGGIELGGVTLRFDSLILLAAGLGTICAVHLLITRTRLGLAIRAVAQDGETARVMGIDFTRVVLFTFALGSGLAALAGLINGLYYSEVNFGTGLMLGVIGFSAAVVGGLGNLYGAILGGFLFAALQMLAVVALPLASEYKDVVAFAAVIALIGLKPTGLIGERAYERV